MKITRVIALAVIAASSALGVVQAKTLADAGEPAEYPPASFDGRQYVDSKGCVFIRAGIDGNVTWVPRVSRSRKVLCGYPPTLAKRAAPAQQPAQTAATAPAPEPAPKKTVRATVPVTTPAPAAKPVVRKARAPAPAPKPAPKRVVRKVSAPAAAAAPKPAPKRVVRKVYAPAPASAPKVVRRRAAAPVLVAPAPAPKPVASPAPRKRRVVQSAGCPGRSALSNRYTAGRPGFRVRCGPQTDAHVTYGRTSSVMPRRVAPAPVPAPRHAAPVYQPPVIDTAPATRIVRVTPRTRIAPKHVYERQVASYRGLNGVPEGYKRVWMDGRLNPHRGHQDFAGKAQMDLMWTKTVPRRLIVRETGRVVTQDYPGLMYPYVSYAQQRRANVSPVYAKKHAAGHATAAAPAPAPKAVVSTRSSAAPSHRYVQAGVYTTRAQAQKAAGRISSLGLPARLGSMTRNGQSYSLLLAGPFNSQAQLDSALSRTRGAGFGNAVARN
ncbi:SPOR domain-containing protein [Roseovarius spongiae]|uniref:SPOR domain-containing protein n=1 Tax=Roseovarius spongiae TaxID=2320272 RepID=A0A3A8AXT2_9RHOB|nr:SPOR domain-containing protein [Roseovarius spongiae]RKF16576.1 SPOR domain-containing protein [Roseovarius spongiae]